MGRASSPHTEAIRGLASTARVVPLALGILRGMGTGLVVMLLLFGVFVGIHPYGWHG
jgi:hypothetical protein